MVRSLDVRIFRVNTVEKSDFGILCKGISIEAKDQVKYLGVVLEHCPSGENIVISIIQKANPRLELLYRKQTFLIFTTKKSLLCLWYDVILTMHVVTGILACVKLWKIDYRLPKIKLFVLFFKCIQGYM